MNTIDEQVFDGIRKTINRFREKPFHYFTEADIHSSLLNDIMTGAPDVLSVKENNISIDSESLLMKNENDEKIGSEKKNEKYFYNDSLIVLHSNYFQSLQI